MDQTQTNLANLKEIENGEGEFLRLCVVESAAQDLVNCLRRDSRYQTLPQETRLACENLNDLVY